MTDNRPVAHVVDTYSATYIDSHGDNNLPAYLTITTASGSPSDSVSVGEDIYDDATQSTGGSELHTGHTDYNSLGQVSDTYDQYGDSSHETVNHYDINGHLIETINPDQTETQGLCLDPLFDVA